MKYRGFDSVAAFEEAARSHGLTAERVPFHRGAEQFFVLLVGSGKSSLKIWTLFPADESREIMRGVDTSGMNFYMLKLAAAGYFPG